MSFKYISRKSHFQYCHLCQMLLESTNHFLNCQTYEIFISYLAAVRPTLGHWQRDSLTQCLPLHFIFFSVKIIRSHIKRLGTIFSKHGPSASMCIYIKDWLWGKREWNYSFSQGEWFKTTMIEEKCYGNELWVLSLTFCRNNVVTTIVSTKFPGLKDEKHLTTFILNFTIFINL